MQVKTNYDQTLVGVNSQHFSMCLQENKNLPLSTLEAIVEGNVDLFPVIRFVSVKVESIEVK